MGVTREKLFEEVWAEPMTTVAKRYDVSSSFLGRVCERLNVPRPARGYWQQLAVGVKVKKAALPVAQPGGELEWGRDALERARSPIPAEVSTAPRPRRSRGTERPEKHPLLLGARAHFDHARESRDLRKRSPSPVGVTARASAISARAQAHSR